LKITNTFFGRDAVMWREYSGIRFIVGIAGTWKRRQPYAVTKMALITGGTVSALLAAWNVLTAYNAEQFVVYGMGSMIFFMWRYALTHL